MANRGDEVVDWSRRTYPGEEDNARQLTEAEGKEIELFGKQDRFVQEESARHALLEAQIHQMRERFAEEQNRRWRDTIAPFMYQVRVWSPHLSYMDVLMRE